MARMRIFLMLALAACLAACSPEQNWRQITFEGTNLKAQLPCKPDRTTREVPLGGAPVQLAVAGCESGNAMVAVMTAALAPGMDAQAVLQGIHQQLATRRIVQQIVLQIRIALDHPDVAQHFVEHAGRTACAALLA
jgi:hypothetical protein